MLSKILRRVHLYLALFLSPWILVYAFSTQGGFEQESLLQRSWSVFIDLACLGLLLWFVSGFYMCGGPGGVFLHARPEQLRTLRPGLTGWMAHKRPFDFEVGEIEFRDDAFRLLSGTPSIPCLYAIQPGIEVIAAVGVGRIRAKSQRQTAAILGHAGRRGWAVRTPLDPSARGGTVVVDPPHAYEISRELIARGILVDFREGSGIRISPHFYNTDGEVRAALEAVDEILDSGAWRRHESRRDFVT